VGHLLIVVADMIMKLTGSIYRYYSHFRAFAPFLLHRGMYHCLPYLQVQLERIPLGALHWYHSIRSVSNPQEPARSSSRRSLPCFDSLPASSHGGPSSSPLPTSVSSWLVSRASLARLPRTVLGSSSRECWNMRNS
jgi:hypothetical protein